MNAEQREQRPYRSECGVWMESSESSQSIARAIAVDVMRALGLDHINDFRTRDKIICAIGNRVDRTLDEATALGKTLTPEQVARAQALCNLVDPDCIGERMFDLMELLEEIAGEELIT